MVLLIMAAGSGSRYGKLKQFDELGPKGEFLMEFSIYDAIKNGFNHIVLITKKENKDFLHEYLRDKIDNSIKIDVVVQEINNLPNNIIADSNRQKPWGTAHAVWCAKNYIDTDFAITTAGSAFSVNETLTQGDAIQSATTVSSGVVGSLPSLGSTTTVSGGVTGGTITSLTSGVHTCGGTMGAGSSCTATSIIETFVGD